MNREKLIDQLIEHESLELFPYKCTADRWTLGVGRNISDKGITREEALYLLNNDVVLCGIHATLSRLPVLV